MAGLINTAKKKVDTYLRARTLRANDGWRDPLWRKPGESLDSGRFTQAQLEQKKGVAASRDWASNWQQDPRTQGAGQFDRLDFIDPTRKRNRVLDPDTFDNRVKGLRDWVRGYDFAYTAKQWNKTDPDYTCCFKSVFDIDYDTGIFDVYVSDMIMWREGWNDSKKRIRALAEYDGPECWIFGEGNGPQAAALQDIQGMPGLQIYTVIGIPGNMMSADKSARAQAWISRAQDGRIWLRKGPWNEVFFDYGEAWPNGTHDDPIDGFSVTYHGASMRAQGYSADADEEAEEVDAPEFNKHW